MRGPGGGARGASAVLREMQSQVAGRETGAGEGLGLAQGWDPFD